MSDDNTKFIPLDNSSAHAPSILGKMTEPRNNPEIARVAEEAKIGNLDDHVDITDPDYDETKAQEIEATLDPHYREEA